MLNYMFRKYSLSHTTQTLTGSRNDANNCLIVTLFLCLHS